MRALLLSGLLLIPTAAALAMPAERAPDPARIEALVRKLGARYLDDREAARTELERTGDAAEPALRKALDNPDVRIRRAACDLLGRLRSRDAADRLVDLLLDADPYVQEAAREALIRIGAAAHETIRKARKAGRISAALAETIVERPLRAAVEAALDRCISKDFGWGFYEHQFKDLKSLGPSVPGVLVKLFTTPPAEYVFTHDFGGASAEDPTIEYRKMIIQRLAGEALVEMRDPSVLPAMRDFVAKLEQESVELLTEDVKGDLYKTAAGILRHLGEPATYEKIIASLRKSAGVAHGPDGAPILKSDGIPTVRQAEALSELAMMRVKHDGTDEAIWAYRRVIGLGDRAEKSVPPGGPNVEAVQLRSYVKSAHYNLACALSLAGRKAEAVESLKRAVAMGYQDADWIKRDGDLNAIREEPGYREILLDLEQKKRQLDALRRGMIPEVD